MQTEDQYYEIFPTPRVLTPSTHSYASLFIITHLPLYLPSLDGTSTRSHNLSDIPSISSSTYLIPFYQRDISNSYDCRTSQSACYTSKVTTPWVQRWLQPTRDHVLDNSLHKDSSTEMHKVQPDYFALEILLTLSSKHHKTPHKKD